MIYGLSPSDLFMNGFGTDTYAGLYVCSRHSHTTCDPFTPPLRPVPQPMTTVFYMQLLMGSQKKCFHVLKWNANVMSNSATESPTLVWLRFNLGFWV